MPNISRSFINNDQEKLNDYDSDDDDAFEQNMKMDI